MGFPILPSHLPVHPCFALCWLLLCSGYDITTIIPCSSCAIFPSVGSNVPAGLCIHHLPSLRLPFPLTTSWARVLKTSCPSYFICCVNASTELHIDNKLKCHWALARSWGPAPTWVTPSVPMELVFYGESDGEREQSARFRDREILFHMKTLHFCTTCLLLCTWFIFPCSHYFLYLLGKPHVRQSHMLFTLQISAKTCSLAFVFIPSLYEVTE